MNQLPQKLAINFDFGEVNTTVFRNAQIYLAKKQDSKRKILVITPYELRYLFVNADYLAVINKEWLNVDYRTILEYLKDRRQKFYIESGVEKLCLERLKKIFSEFIYERVDSFCDLNFPTTKYDRTSWLKQQFLNLEKTITEQNLYMNLIPLFALNEKIQHEGVRKFIDFPGAKVVIRTRNFVNKQACYNSKFEVLSKLAIQLLERGIFVLNLGCPLLSLKINHDLYCEIDHNMPFEDNLALCELANACIMSAVAGLFTGFAASNINMIQIDDEWSTRLNVKLYDARREIGIDDIDIRSYLGNDDYTGAADYIVEKIGGLRRLVTTAKLMPGIVYL
jgi:hypothetical protein